MPLDLGSLVRSASGAFKVKDERTREQMQLRDQRQMAILQRGLLEAQIGKLQREGGETAAAANAYLEQYPELQPFRGNPAEVIARGRARDQEGLMRERPMSDYPVVDEHGQIVMVPRERQPTNLRPIRTPSGSTPAVPSPQEPPAAPQPAPGPNAPKPSGIRRFQPGLITPSPAELDASNWAAGVVQGFTGIRDLWKTNPDALREAIPFLQTLDITASAPGIGQVISGVVRGGAQAGLSPAAQQAVQSFLRWTASRVFATGGKQLTQNEIRAAISQYLPAVGEDDATSQQRLVSMAQDATNVLLATGRAYNRIKGNLQAAGAPDLGEFDPYTQQFTHPVTFETLLGPQPAAPRQSRYGYVRPQ